MESLGTVWSALDSRRRIAALVTAALVFGAVLMLARSASQDTMALLYSGLEPQAAGEVVAALEQRGIAHEVRGASILVPESDRDMLRMVLATEGLPANSAQGYELLDSLSGFGTTSQMFDAAYWRAKEGELARTIVSSPQVRAARVHISSPSNRPFQRDQKPTAAVTVTTQSGMVTPQQAQAFRYLVASAVSGLTPEDVAVIDATGGLIVGGTDAATTGGESRSAELRARAERILEARVGLGNAIVEVSVETDTESETILERRIDPESRVAISTNHEERTSTSQDGRGGDVTVASNLPDGAAAATPGSDSNQTSETRDLTNYDLSETSREVQRTAGAVKRLTVAVLVNQIAEVDADGQPVSTPRSEEELAALGELVASAVGLDRDRGDVLTVRSMSFEPLAQLGTEVAAAGTGLALDMMSLIQLAVLAVVALILGLFVVRPILSPRHLPATLPLPRPPEPALAYAASDDALDGEFHETASAKRPGVPLIGSGSGGSGANAADQGDPVARLRQLIDERQDDTIRVLQSWMEDPEEQGQA